MATFKIHPAIGVARIGNDDAFYLAPEQPGHLPIWCDAQGMTKPTTDGNDEVRVEAFKNRDDLSRILRQGARFKVYAYDSSNTANDNGREIAIGDVMQFGVYGAEEDAACGVVADIEWTVHLANKKSSWYQFQETQGRHGYAPDHPLRNPTVTDPDERRQLIIDPGPVTISCQPDTSSSSIGVDAADGASAFPPKHVARGKNPGYPQTFPPRDIQPNPIDTLGELIVNQQPDNPEGKKHVRLIVLGGKGNSGSSASPVIIKQYANNDGWFDDTSDGPVTARIRYAYLPDNPAYKNTSADLINKNKKQMVSSDGVIPSESITVAGSEKPVSVTVSVGYADVDVPAWVVSALPRFAPQILDMITMDDAMYDVFVRNSAYAPQIYGVPPYDGTSNTPQSASQLTEWQANAQWNPSYYPKFYQEIWPILERPYVFNWVFVFDVSMGGDPHNRGTGGNLDKTTISLPPRKGVDEYQQQRQFIYGILRKQGQENMYQAAAGESGRRENYRPRAMPQLCGNNPLTNVAAEKFLRLTDTQLFLLKQWADGKFVNEYKEWDFDDKSAMKPFSAPPATGAELDRGVLGNVAGGAFCPGMEITWIALNPAIYSEPYRIQHAPYQAGQLTLPKVVTDADPSDSSNSFALLSQGLEPGDLTKYMALPWQSDFTQCTQQPIDITYDSWNNLYLDSTGDPAQQQTASDVPWWPAHRPIVIFCGDGNQYYWASGIPENNVGGLRMVTAWKDLGFLRHGPGDTDNIGEGYYMQEYNEAALGPLVVPGKRRLGNPTLEIEDE